MAKATLADPAPDLPYRLLPLTRPPVPFAYTVLDPLKSAQSTLPHFASPSLSKPLLLFLPFLSFLFVAAVDFCLRCLFRARRLFFCNHVAQMKGLPSSRVFEYLKLLLKLSIKKQDGGQVS